MTRPHPAPPILAIQTEHGWRGRLLTNVDGRMFGAALAALHAAGAELTPQAVAQCNDTEPACSADRTAAQWLYLLDPGGGLSVSHAATPGAWRPCTWRGDR